MKATIILSLLLLCVNIKAQETMSTTNSNSSTVDQVLEGGQIVIDLVQILKSDKSRKETLTGNCKKDNTGNLCFLNGYSHPLKIVVISKITQKMQDLILPLDNRQCAYRLPAGAYTISVQNMTDQSILLKGDVLVERCQDEVMRLKPKIQ